MPIKKSPLPKSEVQGSKTAKSAASLTPATKKRDGGRQPKHHAPKDRMSTMLRRAKILQAAIEGKNITKAAIETGLSPKSAADQASKILRDPITQRAFVMILAEKGLTDEFLAEKIRSLLDAKQTLFFQKDGEVTDSREVEALETQRKTAELAAKLMGHLWEQDKVDMDTHIMPIVVAVLQQQSDGKE